jgi:SAM-dependent methyltransferase
MEKSFAAYNSIERTLDYGITKSNLNGKKVKLINTMVETASLILPQDAYILELGAGTGHLTESLLNLDMHRLYVGSDPTRSNVQVLDNRFSYYPGFYSYFLDYLRGESWEGERMDCVASSMAVHYHRNKGQLFSEVYRWLKPGGWFMLADIFSGQGAEGQAILDEYKASSVLGQGTQIGEKIDYIHSEGERSKKEGKKVESLWAYQNQLVLAGFASVNVLWMDHWLGVMVARRPD